jgi:integrase
LKTNKNDKIIIPPSVQQSCQSAEFQLIDEDFKKKKGEKRASLFTDTINRMFKFQPAVIYKGKNEWYIEYYFQNPDNPAIYDRHKYRKGLNNARIKKNPTERNARARAIQIMFNNLLANNFNPNKPIDFDTFVVDDNCITALRFALEIKKSKSKKIRTHQSYSSGCNKLIKWLTENELHNKSIKEIDHQILMRYFDDILLVQELAPKSYNGQLSYVRAFFSELKARKKIDENPCLGIPELHTEQGKKNTPMTEEEYNKYEAELPVIHPRLYLFTQFIYYAFLREQETCDLRREQLDFANRIIHVQSGSTKNSRTIAVKMHEKLATALIENRVDLLKPKQYIFSVKTSLAPGNGALWRNRISELWKDVVKEGLEIDKDMYALRHLSAKRFIINGGKSKHLQMLMRHSTLTMTENYIASLVPEDFGKIEDRIK